MCSSDLADARRPRAVVEKTGPEPLEFAIGLARRLQLVFLERLMRDRPGMGVEHRGDAFAACEFIMDFLKTRAPFWKKEQTPQGARWVEARSSDDDAAARWDGAGQSGGVSSPGPV